MLNLYNTASRSVEAFKPIQEGRVGLYCCGPTVYLRAHIGNLRAYVMEDVLRRTLESVEGFDVKHVMNITDVGHLTGDGDDGDDKMEKSAKSLGKSAWEIAKEYESLFRADTERLNILQPTATPRATETIDQQIELVKLLEEKGYTYRTTDGLYFDTSKMQGYGRLSGQRLEEKQEGARVDVNSEKRNATDFALWKFSPSDAKRQMEWDSPWGVGFPGWHIECSAMSRMELGQPFDIHCGGVDHIPVHHENEIAQSECAYGETYVHHWMHVEFLMVDGGKMSKSIGNVYDLDELKARGIEPVALRFFFLGAHYRSKQNFTWEAIQGAQNAYEKLKRTIQGWDEAGAQGIGELEMEFRDAMEDDLNTPKALAVLWKLVDSDHDTASKRCSLQFMDRVLGLGVSDLKKVDVEVPGDIKHLADLRVKAKQEKNWVESDRIRDELLSKGWIVKDTKEGYELEKN